MMRLNGDVIKLGNITIYLPPLRSQQPISALTKPPVSSDH
jgi:hypothetical protein